jgi:hypothetical protein
MVTSLGSIRPLQDGKAFHRTLNADYTRLTVLRGLKYIWHKFVHGSIPLRACIVRWTRRWSIILTRKKKTLVWTYEKCPKNAEDLMQIFSVTVIINTHFQ